MPHQNRYQPKNRFKIPSFWRLRFWHFFLIGLCLVLSISACRPTHQADTTSGPDAVPTQTVPKINLSRPLDPVDALPVPELPDWIEQISPTETATALSQIRINFTDPLIPVQQLDDPSQTSILEQFQLVPEIPGQFRFLTPRMVGFAPEQALPAAARFQVVLKAGLGDLNGHQLEQDLAWSFDTPAINITNFPSADFRWQDDRRIIDLDPVFELTSNVELDLASLKDHLKLTATDNQTSSQNFSQKSVGLDVAPKVPAEDDDARSYVQSYVSAQARFDPSQWTWDYTITPKRSLPKATTYTLEITPGLKSAWGNVPSDQSLSEQLQTYAPLRFQTVNYTDKPSAGGAYGRFVNGRAELTFNNGLSQESVLEAMTIEPPPKEGLPVVQAYEGNRYISLNPWALEPATRYTITLDSTLTDIFGQSLGESVTIPYDTGDVAANIWAPSNLHIFPSNPAPGGTDLNLHVSAVNVPDRTYKAAYRRVQPTDLVYVNSASPGIEQDNLLPEVSTWSAYPIPGEKNQTVDLAIPLREQLGSNTGMLAYGVQAKTNTYDADGGTKQREPAYYGLVQLTNLGVFAQWFPQSGLVQVNHLDDGSPTVAAQVEVYASKLYFDGPHSPPVPCAIGTTNSDGTWTLGLAQIQACAAEQNSDQNSSNQNSSDQNLGQGFSDPPELLTIVKEAQDWAFVRTLAYDGAYSYGIYGGWESDRPLSRGTIFSDRALYKPGETAWFTANAYLLKNGTLQSDPDTPYQVVIEDPNGDTIDFGRQTTNPYSTFDLTWEIPANQPLGSHIIRATRDDGVVLSGEFRVAEFKPPNFRVDVGLDQTTAQVGDTVAIAADSQYLFGAPVQGGEASYYVTRQPTSFQPEGWSTFSFGRRWFWPEERPEVSSDVLQVTAPLDGEGKGEQTITVDQDVAYPMTYRVDVEVTDVSNLSVADSQSFTALPSDRLIGLSHTFVADAGQAFPVDLIVTDPTGKGIKGQKVRVELQQMVYSSVTQVRAGSQTAKNQVEYKTVDSQTVTSKGKAITVDLTPPESGSYRIQANFANADTPKTATDSQFWATGATPAYWGGRYTNNRLEVKLDKETYQPGETATVLLQSPYDDAELYFAVVRHDVIYKTVTHVTGGAPQIQFTVTPDMVPNAAIEAVLVRQGQPLRSVEPGRLDKLVRIGFAPFNTDLADQYLQVNIKPQAKELPPQAEQTVDLTLKDASGKPIQGQFTVMAVNEAVLQLTGYRLPDLVQTVYAEQAISTRFRDNRPDVVLQPLTSPLAKGWGYGGGLSAATASPRVRDDFQPIAYYNGAVETNARGKAQVRFTLPDNLTTWRIMAVATDGQLHFGQADTTFLTRQPLITNPILPQFARPGDRFQVGLSVTNTTDQRGPLTIRGKIRGTVGGTTGSERAGAIAFIDSDDPATTQLQTQTPKGTEAHRFTVQAQQPGETTIQFTSQDQGQDQGQDAFAVPLPIKAHTVLEQVIETGVTETQATIPINIDPSVIDAGGLELTLASTLIPELTAPAQQVLDNEPLPFLEPLASRLAIASGLELLSLRYGQAFDQFDLPQQASQALQQLQALQQADGGFAFWPGRDSSSIWTTPYAARAIAHAQRAGFSVDATMVQSLKTYLGAILANPSQNGACESRTCQLMVRLDALTALDALGDRRADFLADLYNQWQELDLVTQLKLARYLGQFSNWSQDATTMANQLQQNIYQTGRTATVNRPQQWRWLASETELQAQALRLWSDRQSPLVTLDRLAQSLLNLRRNGTWPNTYDNAEAIIALVDYSQQFATPPNFTAQAELGGTVLTSAQFQGYQPASTQTKIPMAALPRGEADLVLSKDGPGTLHYLATYEYQLEGAIAGRMNGLRVSRTIHPVNQASVIHTMGLQPSDAVTLDAGQVFDIGLEIITDHPVDHMVISDPLPAGLEAVDTSFDTATTYFQPQVDSWQIRYQTLYADRVQAYGDRLDAGVYSLHYLVRSVTPGTFQWPGAEAHLQYAPEEFGRSASATLMIK